MPPSDFSKSLGFQERFKPIGVEQTRSDRLLTKAVSIFGRAIAFDLKALGRTETPVLEYTLFSSEPIDSRTNENAIGRIGFPLSIHDDLRPFYRIGELTLHSGLF